MKLFSITALLASAVIAMPSSLIGRDDTAQVDDTAPTDVDSNICNNSPIWHVRDVHFSSVMTYSTPSHLAVGQGHISFNLTSDAVRYTTTCDAYSGQLSDFFYGNFVYNCTRHEGPGTSPYDRTTFTFNRPNNVLQINSTWSCGPLRSGIATGPELNLNCKKDVYQNSNWTIGQIYSSTTVDCEPAQFDVKPTLILR